MWICLVPFVIKNYGPHLLYISVISDEKRTQLRERKIAGRAKGPFDRFSNILCKAKTRAVVTVDVHYLRNLYKRQQGKCAITGLPFDFTKNGKNQTMSVDRIEQNKGYEPGNVRLIWHRVNFFRGQMTDHEMLTVCQAICQSKTLKKGVNTIA